MGHSQLAGRPSIGSWISYGLGSENKDLPAFVVMVSAGSALGDQPLADRMWGSGFLPTRYQGVKFRSAGDPVLYLSNPPGFGVSHPRCFTVWMAGGGVKPGLTHGETDDYCDNITRDPVHVHDLHATILNCLGIDHTRLTFKFQAGSSA